MLSSNFS